MDTRPNNAIILTVCQRSSYGEAVTPLETLNQKLKNFLTLDVVWQVTLSGGAVVLSFLAVLHVHA